MLRTIGFAAAMAVTNAIQLELEVDKFQTKLTEVSWETNDARYKELCKAKGKFTDKDFPADKTSIGVGQSADTAKGAKPAPSGDPPIKWRRLSDIYGDKTTLFAPKTKELKHSSVEQGNLGNCYLLSVLAGMDTRPGLVEELFLQENKYEANANGVYSVKFLVNGEPVIVTVDDYVPTSEDLMKFKDYKNNEEVNGWWPAYARSSHYGEIWPMIAEKAWSKLVGTYKATAGGNAKWVLDHLTDDPVERIPLNKGITHTNAKGLAVWNKLKDWSDRNYLLFTGTTDNSYVKLHAYTILAAFEQKVSGKMEKLVTLRNPWGSTRWTEKFAANKTVYKAAKAALDKDKTKFKQEKGWFVVTWQDFIKQFPEIFVAHGEESRVAGGAERKEYRPKVKITGTGTQYIKVALEEDVDLTKDVFAIQTMQGGNRIGTDRNKAIKKVASTGRFNYKFGDKTDTFSKKWQGEGVSSGSWDEGGEGNQHIFGSNDGKKIPKGDYILEFTPGWKKMDAQWNPLKEVTMRVQTFSKVAKLSVVTQKQATETLTGGKSELSIVGENCDVSDDSMLGKNLSIGQATAAAIKKGYNDFVWSGEYTESYGCATEGWCPSNGFEGAFSVYHVKNTKSTKNAVCTQTEIGVPPAAPGGTPSTATPKTAADALKQLTVLINKEEAVKDPNGASDKTLWQTSLGTNQYFCQQVQNLGTSTLKVKVSRFDTKNFTPLNLTFTKGEIAKDLKKNEKIMLCGQYKNAAFMGELPPYQIAMAI